MPRRCRVENRCAPRARECRGNVANACWTCKTIPRVFRALYWRPADHCQPRPRLRDSLTQPYISSTAIRPPPTAPPPPPLPEQNSPPHAPRPPGLLLASGDTVTPPRFLITKFPDEGSSLGPLSSMSSSTQVWPSLSPCT